MSRGNDLRVYAYVNRPYERVASALRRDALGVFQRATASATTRARALVATMRASAGPLELGTDVVVQVKSIEENPLAALGPTTRLKLVWSAAEHPELFPVMEATLAVYALSPEETQVDLGGTYRPPLGVLGAAFDAVVGHRIAEASVHRFVEDLAERLRLDAP